MHQQLQKNPWPLVRPENYRSDTVGTTRNLGFLPTPETKRPLPPDLAEKPPPSILDRFRALLKQREDEDGESPATVDEIVWMYEEVLSELTFNSKPIITDLTIIAGEQKEHGEAIANAICSRILEMPCKTTATTRLHSRMAMSWEDKASSQIIWVPVEQKLPSLYLLDSIIKNIGGYYVEYFAAWLPEVFCETYKQMNASLHPAMHRLFRTWSMVFPSSLLLQIESELQLSSPTSYQSSSFTMLRPSESSSSHQGDGIHVNLNYLEAWHHLEHSNVMPGADPTGNTTISDIEREGMEGAISVKPKGLSGASSKFNDNQLENGVSSSGQIYGQNPSTGPVKYIFDHLEGVSSPSGDARKGLQSEWPLAASKNKLSSPLPPLEVVAARCLSPRGNQFARDIPHARGLEGASWSPSVLTSEIGGERGEKWHDHWQKFWSDDDMHELESSTCSNSNLCNPQQPREFSKSASHDMHMVVDQPDVNSIENKLTVPTWQIIEEDEYDWEDMSPTLADHNQGDDLQLFDFHIGNLSTACSSERLNAAPEPAFQRSKLASHVQQSAVDEFDVNVEDKIAVQNPVHTGIQWKSFTQLPHSPYSRDPQHLLHDFQPREVDPQSPLSVNRIALSSEQQMPLRKKALDAYLLFQRSSEQKMPLGEKALDVYLPFQRPSARIKSSSSEPTHVDSPLHMTSTSTLEKHMLLKQHSPSAAPTFTPSPKYCQPSFLPRLFQHKQAPNQLDNLISLNQPTIFEPHEGQGTLSETAGVKTSPHLLFRSFNNGLSSGEDAVLNTNLPSPLPVASSVSLMIPHFPNPSFQVQRFDLLPLPPGPHPSSQVGRSSQTACSVYPHPLPRGTFSGLISSLIAKGLISLPQPATSQGSPGLEFDAEILKLRHESVINALYVDLPRQCTTCGLRFKFQGEHIRHMDWHVTKNQISENHRQNSSRKWFVGAKEWFSGAETLGTDAVPGFLPTEAIMEKREDEEIAVPADDNQCVCALCGDPFQDFYSDETEEWMYRGTVYLNAPDGSVGSSSRSQFGPIVHAKCRSESMAVSQDFPQDKGRNDEESSQRKKMRS